MRPIITILAALAISACAVTTDPGSARSQQLRSQAPPEGMAAVYVGRDCPISLPRHTVSIDGGPRAHLECMRFDLLHVDPGHHRAAFSSTENTAHLEFDAAAGDVIYIRMDWEMGTGTGDLRVVPELIGPDEGRAMIERMQAVE